MTKPKREQIRQIARAIGRQFNPQKIYLFGSYAYGKPTPDSDVDLLVLMDTPLSNVEQAVQIRQAITMPFATDLLVRTPKQLSQRLEMGDDFMRDIVTRGTILYEAAHA